jgi:hypothetical protein
MRAKEVNDDARSMVAAFVLLGILDLRVLRLLVWRPLLADLIERRVVCA